MIFFRFVWYKSPDMAAWCRENATEYMFSRNSISAITGVWLNESDAIMFKLQFGIDYETKVKE
jgi:hypothetical protein